MPLVSTLLVECLNFTMELKSRTVEAECRRDLYQSWEVGRCSSQPQINIYFSPDFILSSLYDDLVGQGCNDK